MRGNAPVYCELGVIEANAVVVLRRIVRGDFIGEQRVRLEGEEAVGKSYGNEKLVAFFCADYDGKMPAEAGRRLSQVDDDIEDGSRHDTHELRLSEGLFLKMQTPHRMHRRRKREIVLDEVDVDARLGDAFLIVAFGEKPAQVVKAPRL